ncbi:MAG: hypothetical protein L0Y72_12365 [Gemmataceae bacterium]|nr:hypothetical protein [Gemmataceae bacterium]
MTDTAAAQLGFLSVLREPQGYIGGYLVTNLWGRPLEFRLTSGVQPNRVQQILYGPTLESYICADLIGKTLIDKTAAVARCILTDCPAVLELRRRLETPLALVHSGDTEPAFATHPEFAGDAALWRELRESAGNLDWNEPFGRVREALAEARKLGVAARH